MNMDMNLQESIEFLKKYVFDCHLNNQKRIDFSTVNVSDLKKVKEAMKVTRDAVDNEEISESELKKQLGIPV